MQQMNENQIYAERIGVVLSALGYQSANIFKQWERDIQPDYITGEVWATSLYKYTALQIAVEEEEKANIPEEVKPLSRAFVDVLEGCEKLALKAVALCAAGAEMQEMSRGKCSGVTEEEADKKTAELEALTAEVKDLGEALGDKTTMLGGEYLKLMAAGIIEPGDQSGPFEKLAKSLRSQAQAERRQPGKPGFRVKPVCVKVKLPSWKK